MHPKVAGAIQEIDAALFNGDTFEDPDDRAELVSYVERWAEELGLGSSKEAKAASLVNEQSKLQRPPDFLPPAAVVVRLDGSWKDTAGVVHYVKTIYLNPDIDLGCETICDHASWNPDNPVDYPTTIGETVDCITCIVKQAQLCL